MLCFRCGSYNVDDVAQCSVCGQAFLDDKGREVAGVPRRPARAKPSATVFAPGETVSGRYRIGAVIGQGGVGTVYRARDLELDVDIALKAIAPNLLQTPEEQRLFAKQMKQARKLHHPNIIRIYDEGYEGQRRYFTMKLLEGLTLRKIIRLRHDKGQAFTPEEIIPIFHQLAAALDYAHASTWHGDLKPDNIIILPDVLKITDFNLVKGLPLKPFLGIAKSRSKGFPYIAPELRVESTQVDGKADVYSLGVILAEILTGIVFEGHFTRALTAALEQLPPKVDGLVRRALAEHPDGRFAKASDLAKELDASLSKLPSTGLPAPAKPAAQGAGLPARKPTPAAPPPPPMETSPGHVPERDGSGDEPQEIGQSQVLLLEGSDADASAISLRTEALVDEEPSLHMREAAARAEGVLDALYKSAEGDFLPPPLPDLEYAIGSDEASFDGSESFDIPARPARAPRTSEEQETLSDQVPGAIAVGDDRSEDETKPDLLQVGIHEELTALKPAPTADLVERGSDESEAVVAPDAVGDPGTKQAGRNLSPVSGDAGRPATAANPPALDEMSDEDDASLVETATIAGLGLSQELSGPRERPTEALPPPVVPPRDAYVPPTMRPVAPPEGRRRGSGVYIAAGVSVVLLLGGIAFSLGLFDGGATDNGSSTAGASVGARVDAGVVASRADAGVRTVDGPGQDGGVIANLTPPVTGGIESSAGGPDSGKRDPDAEATAGAGGKPSDAVRDVKPVQNGETKPPSQQDTDASATDDKRRLDAAAERERARLAAEQRLREEMDARERDERSRRDEERLARARREDEERRAREAATEKVEQDRVASVATTCPKGMKLIAAGSFTSGSAASDPMRNFGENLAATVEVGAYCIDYYEYPNGSKQPPTRGVTWNQAKSACERKGKRLCTEAEWEHACKGPSDRRFPYGNSWDPGLCNTEDQTGTARDVQPAAAFPKCRSGYNIFAMAGNVEEWTADSFRKGAPSKTVKGGAADRPDWASRCAARRGLATRTSKPTLGFRCCADAK